MASNYQKIRRENKGRYGWDDDWKETLFASRYADRTHFIFELLQNAEDALDKREPEWSDSRAVSFDLTRGQLRVGHFGRPFDEADVRGICGIAKSTKAEGRTDIGHFGLGFKSVYAFTDRPEVHSGPEDFAIERYVLPVATPLVCAKHSEETLFLLPFKPDDESAYADIANRLEGLGASTLLFLRQIEEIEWMVEGGRSGQYLRESERIDGIARRVTLIGEVSGEDSIYEEWLVFSRGVLDANRDAGQVEIAFRLDPNDQMLQTIQRMKYSPLVVFFPTVVETGLGFRIQGPYRTTPSRDNVPWGDSWNKRLVNETALLLREVLPWLRDRGFLDTAALECLPFTVKEFLKPIFVETKNALFFEPLLPRFDCGFTSARDAQLARGEALRELFSPEQLSTLYGRGRELVWLSRDITERRTPDLHSYLRLTLSVQELDPESIIAKLDKRFLEDQTDDWILQLYSFLKDRPALLRSTRYLDGRQGRLHDLTLVRLEDGSHVVPYANGRPQAFLPSESETDFPTVRASVCSTDDSLSFLRSLGLKEPDPVDDVIRYVLPRYKQIPTSDVSDTDYEKDINRILDAYNTVPQAQRDRLVGELCKTEFVKSVDAGDGSREYSKPEEAYLVTERLKELFAGVAGVLVVDDSSECLRGAEIRELLQDCGAEAQLKPVPDESLSREERRYLRAKSGNQTLGRYEDVIDWDLSGIRDLLETLPRFPHDERVEKARLLWLELADIKTSVFKGVYEWTYYGSHQQVIDPSSFVRRLNKTAWVPDVDGELRRPASVLFKDLGWEPNGFLQSKIQFKSRREEELARKLDIDLETIELIKRYGITATQLREQFGASFEGTNRFTPSKGRDVRGNAAVSDGGGSGNLQVEGQNGAKAIAADRQDSEQSGLAKSFAELICEVQTASASDASENSVVLPSGGPKTGESAGKHKQQSIHAALTEAPVVRTVTIGERGPEGKALADEFKSMVHGDYWKRCQICGSTFAMHDGESQVYVVHIVPPAQDYRTNYFGDLLGLCGWHYSLVRYGEWTFWNPVVKEQLADPERLRRFVTKAPKDSDDAGNECFCLPIRFWNVYQEWDEKPVNRDEKVHYSIPHWDYFRKLLEI